MVKMTRFLAVGMLWLAIGLVWLMAPARVLGAHPNIIMDSTALASLRAKAAANTAQWQVLKTDCDAAASANVWDAYSAAWRPAFNTSTYNVVYTLNNITVGYQGGSAAAYTSRGYYDAIWELGVCYQALKLSNPTAAATYAAQGVSILLSMSKAPGVMTLNDGTTRVIGDTTWAAGTGWTPSVAVDGVTAAGASSVALRGFTPGGTVLQNDNFAIGNRLYTVKTSTAADAMGRATVSFATAPSAQSLPAIQTNDTTAAWADGTAVTLPLVVYSIRNGLTPGTGVTISGVQGNNAANGSWTVTPLNPDSSGLSDRLILNGASIGNVAQTNLTWQPLVNDGYGARFYGVALAQGYDWFYDALTPPQKAQISAEMERWYADLKRYGFVNYGMKHPAGNYFAGEWRFLVAFAAAIADEDPTTSAEAYSYFYDTFYTRHGQGDGGGLNAEWVQYYFANQVVDAFHPDGVNYGWFAADNILSAILTANSWKGINLFASPAPAFTWPIGLAKTLIYHTGTNRVYNPTSLPMFDTRGVAFGGNSSPPEAGRAAAGVPMICEYTLARYGLPNADYLQDYLNKMLPVWDQYPNNIDPNPYGDRRSLAYKVLYYDPNAPSTSITNLPLSFYGQGWQEMAMLGSWTNNDVWATFEGGHWIDSIEAGKLVGDAGALTISRGDTRFLVNGPFEFAANGKDGSSFYLYPCSSPSPSPLNVFYVDSGGTCNKQAWFGPGNIATYTTAGLTNNAGISQQSQQGGYVYARATHLEDNYPHAGWSGGGDQSNSPRAVSHWTRDVLYIRPKLFFVRDWTTVPNGAYPQKMLWNFGKSPVLNAVPPGGMTRIDVADTAFKGSAFFLTPDGYSTALSTYTQDGYGGAVNNSIVWHADFAGPANASNTWLSVFDAASSIGGVYTLSSLKGTGADAIQITEINTVVAWPVIEGNGIPLTYTFTPGGTVTHYIPGLQPATAYAVTADGTAGSATTDSGGVLTLTTTGSDPTISVSALVCSIVQTTLVPGLVGSSYSATLISNNCASPVSWTIVSGSLPPGLALNASTGVISGTLSSAKTYPFTVQVTDANQKTSSQQLSITVLQPPPGGTVVRGAAGKGVVIGK